MNYDLKQLLPQDDTISLETLAGENYTIRMFMPSVVGAFVFENQDKFSKLMSGGADSEGMDFMVKLVSLIFSQQYPVMTDDWIRQNISFAHLLLIVRLFGNQLLDGVQSLGLAETAGPIKEPEKGSE